MDLKKIMNIMEEDCKSHIERVSSYAKFYDEGEIAHEIREIVYSLSILKASKYDSKNIEKDILAVIESFAESGKYEPTIKKCLENIKK